MEKRLLLVFAHPDDESFTVGAVVARYVREQGCRVHLLLATRGEAGKPGSPPVCTPVMLAWQREREVREACRILGIERVTFLGFRDGHLADVPRHHLATPIRAYLDAFRPQVSSPSRPTASPVTRITVRSRRPPMPQSLRPAHPRKWCASTT